MHFGGLQCIISIFVFLNLQVIATEQDVEKNFSCGKERQSCEQDDNDNEDCM
ncbi:hypothetical protein NPIL_524761, partial [Nephila pilipes]